MTSVAAWASAELECFNYFLDALQSVEDVTGYRGEYPLTIPAGTDTQMWVFRISGGSSITQIEAADRPYSNWRMDAMLEGIFIDRDTAQTVAGMALNALPADSTTDATKLPDVSRITHMAMPSIERTTIFLDRDSTSSGGEVRAWLMSLPLQVWFGNGTYGGF